MSKSVPSLKMCFLKKIEKESYARHGLEMEIVFWYPFSAGSTLSEIAWPV